jgi:Phasin protein
MRWAGPPSQTTPWENAMPRNETSENPAAETSEAVTTVQQKAVHLTNGYERFVKGLMNVTIQQIELSCHLMEGNIEDFNLLAQAPTPEAFVQAELDVIRRRSERAVGAAQQIGEELHQTWTEMSELATSFATVASPVRPTTSDNTQQAS